MARLRRLRAGTNQDAVFGEKGGETLMVLRIGQLCGPQHQLAAGLAWCFRPCLTGTCTARLLRYTVLEGPSKVAPERCSQTPWLSQQPPASHAVMTEGLATGSKGERVVAVGSPASAGNTGGTAMG